VKRKVIQIAESTQLVSLPRKWALQHNLKKGDEVEVIEDGERVVIRAAKEAKPETTKIDVSKAVRLAERYLIAAYRSGYDEVEVIYDNPTMLQRLQHTASSILMGFEIVNQGERTCVFRNISSSLSSEFDNVLRRVFFITLALARNTHDAITQKRFERLTEGLALETTNNKFTLFCQRLLNKQGGGSYRLTTYLFLTIYQLEKIADHYKYICEHLLKAKNRKLHAKTLKLFQQANDQLNSYYELFYKYDLQKAEEIAKNYHTLEASAEHAFNDTPSSDDEIIHNLLSIVQLTFNLVGIRIGMEI